MTAPVVEIAPNEVTQIAQDAVGGVTIKTSTIPVGLGTQIGVAVAAVSALIAGVTAVLKGDHSEATLTAVVVAAITVWTTIGGRFLQAAAALR